MKKYFALALLFGSCTSVLLADDTPTGYLRLEYWPFSASGNAVVHGSDSSVKDANKTFDHDDWGAIFGGEIRYPKWGANMDVFIGRQIASRQLSSSQSVDWSAEYSILTAGAFWPLLNMSIGQTEKTVGLDGFAGIRSYANTYKLQFLPTDVNNNKDRSDFKSWVDPYIGLRLNTKLSAKWAVELYGDAGGFGIGHASQLSALARANILWMVTPGLNLTGGYRFFHMKSSDENGDQPTQVNLDMAGFTLGAECRFR